MSPALKCFGLITIIVTAACGCITNSQNVQGSSEVGIKEPAKAVLAQSRVKADFQKKMLEQFKAEKKFTAAYGLFSEGGWGDAGQIWVLTNADFSETKVLRAAPNKEAAAEITAKSSAVAHLKETLAASSDLKNVEETMFDGLIYEYSALKKSGADITASATVYIKSTDLTKHPRHNDLISAFASL